MINAQNYQPRRDILELGPDFYDEVRPATFPKSILRLRNSLHSKKIGLDSLSDEQWIEHFAQFAPLPDSLPTPLALRYHGHQFTHYNPDLGDGRGFLFAQLEESCSHRLLDLGTKGSGQTPYSRQGDGRLTLKGAVREALATAYLEFQGVNTSKTFSIIETGESLIRHDEPSPTRSAVLVRLSHSHIRIGTFQRLAYFKQTNNIKKLINYCIAKYYPDSTEDTFFRDICENIARTTAQWMIHGFVHGVLNTDNINITGESFDYGPWRFIPNYDPSFTAAYFDHQSLYAYGRQPQMVLWNLQRLEEALSPVIKEKSFFEAGYLTFQEVFERETLSLFCQKVGILPHADIKETKNLFYSCLQFLEKSKAPYEAFYHHLYCWHQDLTQPLKNYAPNLYDTREIEELEQQLATFQRDPKAKEKNKGDLQTMLIEEVESIWEAIDKNDNWTPFEQKLKALKVNP